jgi:hypothetical protein
MIHLEEGGDSTIRTELPVELTALNGEAVPATLLSIQFRPGENEPSCVITLRLNGDQAQKAAVNGWFHLFPAVTQGSASFEPDSPAELRAALRPAIARRIYERGGDAEAVLAAFLPVEKEHAFSDLGLRQTESWIALDLMQEVELPPALKDSGALRQGLKTDWRKLLGEGPADHARAGQSDSLAGQDEIAPRADQIERVLAEKELKYEKLDDRLIRLHFNSRRGNWVTLIRLEPDEGLYILYSVFPELVPEELRTTVAAQLAGENYDLLNGSFEMDMEDGELRLRTSHFCGGRFDPDTFASLMAEHLMITEHYLPIVAHMIRQ